MSVVVVCAISTRVVIVVVACVILSHTVIRLYLFSVTESASCCNLLPTNGSSCLLACEEVSLNFFNVYS